MKVTRGALEQARKLANKYITPGGEMVKIPNEQSTGIVRARKLADKYITTTGEAVIKPEMPQSPELDIRRVEIENLVQVIGDMDLDNHKYRDVFRGNAATKYVIDFLNSTEGYGLMTEQFALYGRLGAAVAEIERIGDLRIEDKKYIFYSLFQVAAPYTFHLVLHGLRGRLTRLDLNGKSHELYRRLYTLDNEVFGKIKTILEPEFYP